jgi:acyl-CoA dehydrogenase
VRLADQGVVQDWIAESRINIDMARQYVLHAARQIDRKGARAAASEISGIKVAVPRIALDVIDRAIQTFGAAGVSQDLPLAYLWTLVRTIRIADGPDEVHKRSIARRELART